MTSISSFLDDLEKEMKLSISHPLVDTEGNLGIISSKIQNVLDKYYMLGILSKKYIARVETRIINRDNLPIYQYEDPEQCEVFFDDTDGNKNVKLVFNA